ncbi:unnamed protein product [Caenorhabditis auriculariae]|uniref:alcohol dehydrogenase n=1 Tax=Caenorhabditis auriculariae TaxID=2777116 RepID=A0A8S1H7D6_9PELO|nr:unnamed protein product [Caenorhabditis auriculariae]
MVRLPETQRALIFDQYNGPLEIRNIPIPEPKDDEILVRILYSGICHTDLHVWLGEMESMTTAPLVGGHEGAGEVIEVGAKVRDWKVGDRAGIKLFNNHCLSCEPCKNGYEQNCKASQNYGFTRGGTFQEYLVIRAIDAAKIPSHTNLAEAAPIMCAGVTVYKALKQSEVKPGQTVVLTGAGGGLGSLGIQFAKAMGMRVVAIDNKIKKDHCLELGAEWFVDGFDTENVIKTVIELTDGGAHGVVNLASAKKPMEQTFEYVRENGVIVFVGLPKDSKITLDTSPFIFRGLTLKGSIVGNRADVDEAMDFVARGIVKVPLEKVKLEEVAEVYQRMLDGKINSRCVVDLSF